MWCSILICLGRIPLLIWMPHLFGSGCCPNAPDKDLHFWGTPFALTGEGKEKHGFSSKPTAQLVPREHRTNKHSKCNDDGEVTQAGTECERKKGTGTLSLFLAA